MTQIIALAGILEHEFKIPSIEIQQAWKAILAENPEPPIKRDLPRKSV